MVQRLHVWTQVMASPCAETANHTWARGRGIVVVIDRVHARCIFNGAVVEVHVFIRCQLCSLRREGHRMQGGETLRNILVFLFRCTLQWPFLPPLHPHDQPSSWIQHTQTTWIKTRADHRPIPSPSPRRGGGWRPVQPHSRMQTEQRISTLGLFRSTSLNLTEFQLSWC